MVATKYIWIIKYSGDAGYMWELFLEIHGQEPIQNGIPSRRCLTLRRRQSLVRWHVRLQARPAVVTGKNSVLAVL